MSKRATPEASKSLLQRLEQVAQLVSTARHLAIALERGLQLLAETVGARGGAVVLVDTSPRRMQGCSWGVYQEQMIQVGRELVDGLGPESVATARHTILPKLPGTAATEGMVLSGPLQGFQQALGVVVLFCPTQPLLPLDTALTFLNTVGTYVGLYLHTTALQERLKAQPDPLERHGGGLPPGYDPDQVIGHSTRIRSIMHEIQQAARSRSTVIIRGESGTGKELGARALHKLSERRDQAFIKLNCAALPETLLESELFGHERGAFTGAIKMRRGRFELADKGTLFLDEIGDMSLAMQVKLLRVLQERTFERVGGHRPIEVDVRIITATNVDLEEAVRAKRFREDLYYRLHVVPIVLPPLRERKEDIPLLVGHFLGRYNAENRKSIKISSAAMDLIVEYDWPGNVRELENCVERMIVMARRDVIAPEDVPLPIGLHPLSTPVSPPRLESGIATLPKAVADIERERLIEALRRSGGVQTRAASLLGITPRQLGYKLRKYRIAPKTLIG